MARSVGRVDPFNLLDEISPEQFRGWMAADQIDAGGWRPLFELLALIAAAICNSMGAEDIRPSHFFKPYGSDEEEIDESQTPAIQRARICAVVAMQRAAVAKGGGVNVSSRKLGRQSQPKFFWPDGRNE